MDGEVKEQTERRSESRFNQRADLVPPRALFFFLKKKKKKERERISVHEVRELFRKGKTARKSVWDVRRCSALWGFYSLMGLFVNYGSCHAFLITLSFFFSLFIHLYSFIP